MRDYFVYIHVALLYQAIIPSVLVTTVVLAAFSILIAVVCAKKSGIVDYDPVTPDPRQLWMIV